MKKVILITVLACLTCAGIFFGFFKNKIFANSNIPIAMALDDNYTYPSVVAITSMLENRTSNTKYDFYIMHPGDFKDENKTILKSLEKKYKHCNINLINMEEKYKNAHQSRHITTAAAYYRLSLSEILPNIDKIIWLDGDTITFGDLKEMYDIDMQGYYYKGFLDDNVDAVDKDFGIQNDHVICSGVMLINLKELRNDDVVNKFSKFIEENNEKLTQHDQTTINVVCYKKNGILPAKFGIYNYKSLDTAKEQAKVYRFKDGYSEQELEDAYNNPFILHCNSKPWKNPNYYGGKQWWEYAKKTDYYKEIASKYSNIF